MAHLRKWFIRKCLFYWYRHAMSSRSSHWLHALALERHVVWPNWVRLRSNLNSPYWIYDSSYDTFVKHLSKCQAAAQMLHSRKCMLVQEIVSLSIQQWRQAHRFAARSKFIDQRSASRWILILGAAVLHQNQTAEHCYTLAAVVRAQTSSTFETNAVHWFFHRIQTATPGSHETLGARLWFIWATSKISPS